MHPPCVFAVAGNRHKWQQPQSYTTKHGLFEIAGNSCLTVMRRQPRSPRCARKRGVTWRPLRPQRRGDPRSDYPRLCGESEPPCHSRSGGDSSPVVSATRWASKRFSWKSSSGMGRGGILGFSRNATRYHHIIVCLKMVKNTRLKSLGSASVLIKKHFNATQTIRKRRLMPQNVHDTIKRPRIRDYLRKLHYTQRILLCDGASVVRK